MVKVTEERTELKRLRPARGVPQVQGVHLLARLQLHVAHLQYCADHARLRGAEEEADGAVCPDHGLDALGGSASLPFFSEIERCALLWRQLDFRVC